MKLTTLQNKAQAKRAISSDKDYLPRGKTVWLLFDMTNGHKGMHRYCWWFDNHKEAMEHRSWQMKVYKGAPLSMPIKFVNKD